MLALIPKTMTDEDNKEMIELPTELEIETMVRHLPRDKSPGIDGITLEILQLFWPVMKDACVKLIHTYWRDGKLS